MSFKCFGVREPLHSGSAVYRHRAEGEADAHLARRPQVDMDAPHHDLGGNQLERFPLEDDVAVISGLATLKEECEVVLFTDSEYLRQGITEWLPRWRANDWRTADRKPVKNDDLWRQLYEMASRHRVTWQWLKGHAGHPENERCDQLAREEVVKIRRHHSPEKLGELRRAFIASRDPNASQGSLL